jgi:hypothetical protein
MSDTRKPNWTRLERERQSKDEELYESQLIESVEYIQLNMNNYDEFDVAQINEWAIEAFGRIEALEAENAKLRRILRQVGLHAEAEDE